MSSSRMRIKRNEKRAVRNAWIGFRPTQCVLLASTWIVDVEQSLWHAFWPIYRGVRLREIDTTRSAGDR